MFNIGDEVRIIDLCKNYNGFTTNTLTVIGYSIIGSHPHPLIVKGMDESHNSEGIAHIAIEHLVLVRSVNEIRCDKIDTMLCDEYE